MASVKQLLYDTLDDLEEEKLKRFKSYLRGYGHIPVSVLEKADATDTVDQMLDRFGPESAVKITLDILKKINQNHLAEQLESKLTKVKIISCPQTEVRVDLNTETVFLKEDRMLQRILEIHKMNMKKKAKYIFEGNKENGTDLKAVYTELFITEGDTKDVNQEHEILKIDDVFKCKKTHDKPIKCNDIFTELGKNKENIVLTKGVAGIGKTVSVHKFILDWAEENTSQDIHCVFLLLFREINTIKDKEVNLHEFLLQFYPKLKDLEKSKLYKECKLAFIFDGLDESRLPLNFKSTSKTLNTVEERASVDVLFTSLIKGDLLPSALVWVTSRPAAASQIPPRYVGLFTEVRGFTDQQKEQYFRKKITDENLASKIISHIKTSRSLYIMCHIPVFCWITATVLQDILIENNAENISTTLTEMYIHFLRIQMNMKSQKYDKQEEREHSEHLHLNRKMILKLAKLAFEQLKKENIVFYEEDLKACGIDVSKDTEFTGMIAEIFKMEDGLYKTKVFCFVHLSVQEFLAAVHVFICYLNKKKQEIRFFFEDSQTTARQKLQFYFKNVKFHDLTKRATDKAIQSKRGHLDLFLRFLLGISLESNQNLLKGLITDTKDTSVSIRKISARIKQLQKQDISEETAINLFYCLIELKDHSLYEEIQSYLSSDEHPGREFSSSMCTLLTYILLISEKVLDEFNPKRFTSSSSNYTRLIPAVRCCRKALFHGCGFDETCCETVSSALQESSSHLTELDLSNNHLQDSGRTTYLGVVWDSTTMQACLSPARIESILAAVARVKEGRSLTVKQFQQLLGLMAAASNVIPFGLLYMRPLQWWLKTKGFSPRGNPLRMIKVMRRCLRALDMWRKPWFLNQGLVLGAPCRRVTLATDASLTGWGGAVISGRPALGLWSGRYLSWHINCLEMLAVFRALKFFLPDLRDRHVLVRIDSTAVVYYINHQGGLRSRPLYKLAHHILVWSQDKLFSLRAVHIPGHLNVGADVLSRQGPRPGEWMLHPEVFIQLPWDWMPWYRRGRLTDRSASGSSGESSPGRGQFTVSSPVLAGPSMVLGPDISSRWLSMGDSHQEGSPLTGGGHHSSPPLRAVEAVGVASEGAQLIASGLSTEKQDPVNCPVGTVLEFLQARFSTGLSHSTLKVYVAAISAYHALLGGMSVGKDPLVVCFLRGVLRLRPPTRPHVPTWDLAVVLEALCRPPFEPIEEIPIQFLIIKTALLLALTSLKQVGDLQALSVAPSPLEFTPGMIKAFLYPRPGYVPKVPTNTPQQVVLQAFCPPPFREPDQQKLNCICPVRALDAYVHRAALWRKTDQLFVCYCPPKKGYPATKQDGW
ncbi:NLR family CARD domain-containing protein 3 [Labeo rohita]|uniref:NLR family CARD domain-containing protein 3 n=1 Tax=Labeo rohita TaxID=84645 RepID=A0ABQ8L8F6_LABRO|nr:NLR family CARD domain-containing protein 3 [Labeo rohita]